MLCSANGAASSVLTSSGPDALCTLLAPQSKRARGAYVSRLPSRWTSSRRPRKPNAFPASTRRPLAPTQCTLRPRPSLWELPETSRRLAVCVSTLSLCHISLALPRLVFFPACPHLASSSSPTRPVCKPSRGSLCSSSRPEA